MVDSRGNPLLEPHLGKDNGGLRLVIADHHQLFRDCLAGVLAKEEDLQIVGQYASAQEALEPLARTGAEVLLLGVESMGDGAHHFVQEVCGRYPALKVILLGREESDDLVVDCLEAGARGYLMRDQPLADLRSAIEVVVGGEIACTPRVAHSLFQRLASLGRDRRRRRKLDFLTLTPRELEILRLIADGLSNLEIARKLFLSVHTVKNHVHKILETLGVHSRWAAVRHAIERGWLSDRRRS
jgi:two-component system, NarL family, response regulator DevR